MDTLVFWVHPIIPLSTLAWLANLEKCFHPVWIFLQTLYSTLSIRKHTQFPKNKSSMPCSLRYCQTIPYMKFFWPSLQASSIYYSSSYDECSVFAFYLCCSAYKRNNRFQNRFRFICLGDKSTFSWTNIFSPATSESTEKRMGTREKIIYSSADGNIFNFYYCSSQRTRIF